MSREIKNLGDAIIQACNWLEILTMDSSHNQSLYEYQAVCFKEMQQFLKSCDQGFVVDLMIRLTEKGRFADLEDLRNRVLKERKKGI